MTAAVMPGWGAMLQLARLQVLQTPAEPNPIDANGITMRSNPTTVAALSLVLGPVSTGVMVWDDDRSVLQLVGASFGGSESVTASYQVDTQDLRSNAARAGASPWYDTQVSNGSHSAGCPPSTYQCP